GTRGSPSEQDVWSALHILPTETRLSSSQPPPPRHQPHEPQQLGVPNPCPPERAEQVLAEFARGWEGSFGLARFVVEHDTDEIIGLVSLTRHAPSCVEVCYGVAPESRGRGLATTILQLITDRILHVDRLADRIEAVIDPKNAVSVRVATKAGFTYEGVRRSVIPATGQTCEDLLYVRTLQPANAATVRPQ
ncbi:GNAT family protein, partial [Actinopolymorpha sp. B9G3]|uniref:GNAT family N-acetyltransferase n=1 Tax=Actinopolymorpha sp. B9G3 TaxID=3158970 RepID=UPI0032D93FC6